VFTALNNGVHYHSCNTFINSNHEKGQDTMHTIEYLKAAYITEANLQEYIKQQNKLIWVEWLIDAKSLNKLVHDLEQAFFELTETQESTA
jgi:hypothetical protein